MRWTKLLLVAVPILVIGLALVGRWVIETEARKNEAALEACFENDDRSERCRVMICLARAENDGARADCIANRGEGAEDSAAESTAAESTAAESTAAESTTAEDAAAE